jgi:transaldolase/glucose-6-phosphate isomerase
MATEKNLAPSAGESLGTATANPLREAENLGQGIWLDFIRRDLITSGDLQRLVDEDGLSGMTSNPTIFEKAMGAGTDYDEAIIRAIQQSAAIETSRLFENIAAEDIRSVADILRPVYDQTKGQDGYISMEVSPGLAYDTAGTIAEARRLWGEVNRPNLMIKVPATPPGIPAIEELLASGINVNITLMFSLAHYEAVAHAYIRGLTRCKTPERMGSVASFFVSRVDTMVDAALEKLGTPEALALRGKIGIANCRAVYQRFVEIFRGNAFADLRQRGARVQRVLWASTSTKNPNYRDTLYVEELLGPDTVNTIPPETLEAFREHGVVRGNTITEGVPEATAALAALKRVGVNLDEITERLQKDGVASFSKSYTDLMSALDTKRIALAAPGADAETDKIGILGDSVRARVAAWDKDNFSKRVWDKDPTLWAPKDTPEITNRLGWLRLPEDFRGHVGNLLKLRDEIRAEKFTHVILLGMGGSSLAPEVFQETFGNGAGDPELMVLDSTHPAAVQAMEKRVDLAHTLFLVSSKSGTTTEMLSFFYYFWQKVSALRPDPGRQFVAVTDPGTPLVKLAAERKFRGTFEAVPEVGGRYSALTMFGLVPAAIIGVDIERLLERAFIMQQACAAMVAAEQSPGLRLGAILGEAALAGRDKVTFVTSPGLSAFPEWVEQLIAESTGKNSKGIVPVANEKLGDPAVYGKDRLFVHLALESEKDSGQKAIAALEKAGHPVVHLVLRELIDLGQEFFRWEMGVAAAGAVIGIQPFNQPDVQLAKDLAHKAMQDPGNPAAALGVANAEPILITQTDQLRTAVLDWLKSAHEGDYIGIDAWLAPSDDLFESLESLRVTLRDRTKLATMLGYGPRFLHSTGQLHKGGPNTGLFLQLLDAPSLDVAVPETNYTFGQLIKAQALGDFAALKQRGRRVIRVQLGSDTRAGIAQIAEIARG